MRLCPLLLACVLAAGSLAACDSATETSLYNPDAPRNAAPVVESVSPSGVVLAGIDVITITGRNFSARMADNFVVFDDGLGASATGVITEATTTMLKVKVPNLPNAALRLRVSVLGAPDYSAPVALPLVPAFLPFGDLDPNILEEPRGIVSDGAGGLFVSVSQRGNSRGIQRFSAAGARQPSVTTAFVWSDLTRGPGNLVYGARGTFAVFGLPAGAAQQPVRPFQAASVQLSVVESDGQGSLWAAGSAGTPAAPATPNLVRFNLLGQAVSTPFQADVQDLKVSNGFLYVAGVRTVGATSEAKVWRLPIQASGALGAEEVVYTAGADERPSALAIAADGTLYVALVPASGSNAQTVPNPLVEIPPGGPASPFYPGVLPSPIEALAWGSGSRLYAVQRRRVSGAGTTATVLPAALFAIETRRQGTS